MAQIIDGKAVSRAVRARVAQETLALKEQGVTPGLAVILVGEDPASQVYVRNNHPDAAECTGRRIKREKGDKRHSLPAASAAAPKRQRGDRTH